MKRSRRAAFTLIEVLIALGLSVMLISAVYASIDLYYRYQSAGRAEIRGQQLLRALNRLLSQDLGSAVLQLPESATSSSSGMQAADEAGASSSSGTSSGGTSGTGSSSGAGSGSSSSSSSQSSSGFSSGSSFDAAASGGTTGATTSGTATTFLGLSDAGFPVVFGLVGTKDLLHLSVDMPSRDLNYVPLTEGGAPEDRLGNLQVVTWGLTSIDSLSLSIMQKSLKTARPGVGLGRRLRDLYSPVAAQETLESQHLLAPEVTEVAFRYFDAGEWFDSWDSIAMGRLPKAVEVQFGFWNPPPVQVGQAKKQDPGTVTYVHEVFKVPLAVTPVE